MSYQNSTAKESLSLQNHIVRWYVSNVSIIFDCSILLYYTFRMFMGFILHMYIIFGTNLLTEGPAHIAVFLPISVFRRKGISNWVQTEWNLWERYFWNKSDPSSLECKSRKLRGPHKIGGRPPCRARPLSRGPLGRPPTYFFLLYKPTYPETSKSKTKHNFHHRNLLYPRDLILEPSPALCRSGNRPRRASTSTSLPLWWVVSSLPQTYGSIVIS